MAEQGVFQGITVISFSWAVVGPLTMKFLADYGATVIRIETNKRPCTSRLSAPYKDNKPGVNRSGYYNHFSANMYSLALNIEHPRSREVLNKLIQQADVVMENFTPGVMEKWGLGYDQLAAIKPDIIMLRQSGFGNSGPYSRQPAFGMVMAAMAGLPNFIGWPDQGPLPLGISAYTDCISPRLAAAALVAALDHRNKTGQGQLLDLSQFEASLFFILPAILDYVSNQREPARSGNANPQAAPHGVYPCKGDDRWCAIAVLNDEQWEALCKVIEKPELVEDDRFSILINRKKNEDELNKIIGAWTSQFTPESIMEAMQAVGVPAGVVKNAADIFTDPELRERGLFWPLEHPDMGLFTHLGQSFVLSETPAQARLHSPQLGEHTEWVCSNILKMSEAEFVELLNEGVFE